MKFLIFILSLSTFYSVIFYNATEFIENLTNSMPADENILINAINNTAEFLKHYIYYKVSSDPPQPDFNSSYFPKMDIKNLFNNIKTNNTNYFDFKNEFISAIYRLNDLHTTPFFSIFPVQNYAYICPLELIAKYNNITNKVQMYGEFSMPIASYFLFKNHQHVVETIENNLDIPIKTINEKDPFDFIQDFADLNLRNRHSTYVYHQTIYSKNNFYMPVTLKDLSNFTVVYESGDNFTTDYIIPDISNSTNDFKFYDNEEDNEKFVSYLSENNNKINSLFSKEDKTHDLLLSSWPFKNLDDIILEFESKNNIQSNNMLLTPKKSKINNNNNINAIEWNYTYKSQDDNSIVFQCRVDEQNHVNVMRIDTFGGVSDSDSSLDVAKQCAYLFDENYYKIVIIIPRNYGGNPIIGYNIIELLSPYFVTRNAFRIKKDINMSLFIEKYNSYNLFEEINSTNKLHSDYIKDGFVSEKYGSEIEEFSKPFAWRVNQKKIEEIKSKLKHKRKPTDIVIITDGFALSSASIFLKNAYKSGAGILVGYNINPNFPDDTFDLGQHSSAFMGIHHYEHIYPEIYNNTYKYLIGLNGITCMASYHEFQESHIPQEYDVQTPDKIINIYNTYNEIYYQDFIKEAIKVLDWYQDNCNPDHKMLVLLSDKCKFDNHLHGGYSCGSDSKWNISNCVAVYCDSGYYYNKISNSCILYPISKEIENEKDEMIWLIILLSSICGALILIIVVLIILYKKKKLCFKQIKKNEESSDYNINDCLIEDSN